VNDKPGVSVERRNAAHYATADDEDLMDLVASGDRAAFSELYDRFSPRVMGLVRRVLVDQAQSEEVVQELFLEVWQRAPLFDRSKGRAVSWVLTISHRRAVDRVRASSSSRERDVRVGIRDYAPSYDTVADQVETSVLSDVVRSAMSALTEIQRQVVSMAYFDGLSQREIADELSVPVGTIKTRLRDGLMKLRGQMEALGVPSF
jgi:RNA polymerase sigma-70 factor (ECF subfamily)